MRIGPADGIDEPSAGTSAAPFPHMLSPAQQTAQQRRCLRLHEAFAEVQQRHGSGKARLMVMLRGLSRRRLRGPYEAYSLASIIRLYANWRRDPQPETLAHRYTSGKPSIPREIIDAVLQRMIAAPTLGIPEALDQERAAWKARKPRRRGKAARFPSASSISRHMAARLPISWAQQRRQRLAALAKIAQLDAMIAESFSTPPTNNK